MQVSTIGLDLAKHVFQVHGINGAEEVVLRRQLRRGEVLKFFAKLPRCLIGMERPTDWLTGLLTRKTARVASVALARLG